MKNNTIKIKAFLCLLLLTCGWVSVQAQQVLTVKGVVVDALKEPLPGASVQVVGMSTGTVTDLMVILVFRFRKEKRLLFLL